MAQQRVEGDRAGAKRDQHRKDADPVDMRRPPQLRTDIDLQQQRHEQEPQCSKPRRKAEHETNRQHEFGVAENVGGNFRRDRHVRILRLEQRKSRSFDLGRQDDGDIGTRKGQVGENAGPLDLLLPGEKKEARHDQPQRERNQAIRNDPARPSEPVDGRPDKRARPRPRFNRCHPSLDCVSSCASAGVIEPMRLVNDAELALNFAKWETWNGKMNFPIGECLYFRVEFGKVN